MKGAMSGLELMACPLGILRKPAPFHPFPLFKEFTDTPERRGTEDTYDGREDGILNEQSPYDAGHAYQKIHYPGACSPIIFRLDDYRMPQSYSQEGGYGYNNSCEIHYDLTLAVSGCKGKDKFWYYIE